MTIYRLGGVEDPFDQWVSDDPEDLIDPIPATFVNEDYAQSFVSPEEAGVVHTVDTEGYEVGATAVSAYYRLHFYNLSNEDDEYWLGWKWQTLAKAKADLAAQKKKRRRNWWVELQRYDPGEGYRTIAGEDVIGASAKPTKAYYRIEYVYAWSDPEQYYWSGLKLQTLPEAKKRLEKTAPPGGPWMGYIQRYDPGEGYKYVIGGMLRDWWSSFTERWASRWRRGQR